MLSKNPGYLFHECPYCRQQSFAFPTELLHEQLLPHHSWTEVIHFKYICMNCEAIWPDNFLCASEIRSLVLRAVFLFHRLSDIEKQYLLSILDSNLPTTSRLYRMEFLFRMYILLKGLTCFWL